MVIILQYLSNIYRGFVFFTGIWKDGGFESDYLFGTLKELS